MMLWERLAPKRIYPAEKMAKMSGHIVLDCQQHPG